MTNETQTNKQQTKETEKAISILVKKIWEPLSVQTAIEYKKFQAMSQEELYAWLVATSPYSGYYTYGEGEQKASLTLVPTSGCPHKFSTEKGKFEIKGGCSMCNYHSEFVTEIAALKALKEKDPTDYSRFIKESFTKTRGKNPQPNTLELISANDTLDPKEFSLQDAKALFRPEGKNLFEKTPVKGYVLEVRADSVAENQENLPEMKKIINGKLAVEIGVEVGDGKGGIYDFIRNNWINKNISSENVKRAIEVAHKNQVHITTNVLIGIPGLTEEQSIDAAVNTVKWLDDIGSDTILLLPLNLKEYTLQDRIHQLKDNPELNEKGLAYGEHTGISWFYTLTRTLTRLVKERPSIKGKLAISQIAPETNTIANTAVYNGKTGCGCTSKARKVLAAKMPSIDYQRLEELKQDFDCLACYSQYQTLLKKQKIAGTIQETLKTLYHTVCSNLFEDSQEADRLNRMFDSELNRVQQNGTK